MAQAPDLKAKFDQIGGIDAVLSGAQGVRFTSAGRTNSWGRSPMGMPFGGPESANPSNNKLYSEVRAAARRDPAAGRQKIADMAQDPANIDALIQFAQRVNWEDPDLASTALEAARPLLPKIEPKSRRASTMQMLVRVIPHARR